MTSRLPAPFDSVIARRLVMALLTWMVLAALRLAEGWDFVMTGRSGDPDSIMRLLQIRDWLGGQGWWDLHQYRLGPTGGTAMHWSRVADLLPASIIAGLTPLLGHEIAERTALIATPIALLFPMTLLALVTARNLAGRAADLPLALILLTAFGTMTLFKLGDIDHHSWQLVFVLMVVWAASGARKTTHGVVAGVATVLSMTVGIETLPEIAAALLALAMLWTIDPAGERSFQRGLGASLMAGGIVSLLVFMSRPWPGGQCDSWTPAIFALVLGGGAILFITASLPALARSEPVARIGALGGGGVLLGVAIATLFPSCLQHPAGYDPLLWTYWLDNIWENESLHAVYLRAGLSEVVVLINAAPLVIAVAILVMIRNRRLRTRWATPVTAAIAGLVMATLHVRGLPVVGALAGILAAALIGMTIRQAGRGYRVAAVGLLPISWMIAGATTMTRAPTAAPRTDPSLCRSDAVMAVLRTLPPATLVVPMTTEPHFLLATPHRSLGGTYHRNAGNHAMIAAMVAPPDEAAPILRDAGASYVLYCPGTDISNLYAKGNPDSLAAALTADRAPPWLAPIARLPHDIRLYRVQ